MCSLYISSTSLEYINKNNCNMRAHFFSLLVLMTIVSLRVFRHFLKQLLVLHFSSNEKQTKHDLLWLSCIGDPAPCCRLCILNPSLCKSLGYDLTVSEAVMFASFSGIGVCVQRNQLISAIHHLQASSIII